MTKEEFFKIVIPDPMSGCWIWMGAIEDERGYGLVYVGAKRTGAHRYSWQLHNGPIPDGVLVCHRCDVPSCVNPDHLFLGSKKDNYDDSRSKGRAYLGDHQKVKTHCPQGHSYEGRNLILYQGRRYCRSCMYMYNRRNNVTPN
jgi:hypothetical protein